MSEALNDVLAASLDGICLFDREHRCTAWSPAMERLTGIATDRAIGRTREELLPDGEQRPFNLSFSAASDGGVVGVARKSEAGVNEMLSVASHKLKTPLTALQIQLGAQLRALQRKTADHDWLAKSTAAAIEQSQRVADVISRVIDISRMDSGRWKLELQPLDLAALTKATVKRLEHTASQNGCDVRCHVGPELQGRWDAQRLEQALASLLANAFKHGAGKPVDVSLETAGRSVLLRVADRGPGMGVDERAKLFDRTPSTALGLWVTKEIIQAHKGEITVESAPGEGTCFVITLPVEGA